MAVEVNLVGEDTHAQLGGAIGEREEARLQPHREEHQRQVAGTERRCRLLLRWLRESPNRS